MGDSGCGVWGGVIGITCITSVLIGGDAVADGVRRSDQGRRNFTVPSWPNFSLALPARSVVAPLPVRMLALALPARASRFPRVSACASAVPARRCSLPLPAWTLASAPPAWARTPPLSACTPALAWPAWAWAEPGLARALAEAGPARARADPEAASMRGLPVWISSGLDSAWLSRAPSPQAKRSSHSGEIDRRTMVPPYSVKPRSSIQKSKVVFAMTSNCIVMSVAASKGTTMPKS